ncbi:TrmH family RNA methyltransferase [Streptomyces sp. MJP52]|nr:TrmH family RNA methyltransferase [Streptomyces sp. MJP52]
MPSAAPELISPRSPRVGAARRLAKRNFRSKERLFLAEGPQAVREAAAHRGDDGAPTLTELFTTPEAADRYPDIVGDARAAGARVHLADEQVIADISTTVTPQGLVGVCRFLDTPFEEILRARPRLVAVLANVRDPGNAGTVLRCADAAGAEAVVLTDASVDLYNPKAVRASVGSHFHLPVAVGVPVEAAVAGLKEAGVTVLAADGAGTHDLDPRAGHRLHGRSHRLGLRQRGVGPAGGDPRARRRRGARPHPRQGREPQPRHGRRRVPLRLRPCTARRRRVPLRHRQLVG